MSFEEVIQRIIREELAGQEQRIADRVAEKLRQHTPVDDCYLSIPKAAELAGYESTDTVHQWIKDGLLRQYGHGRPRVKRSELVALMERKTPKVVDLKDEAARVARRLLGK